MNRRNFLKAAALTATAATLPYRAIADVCRAAGKPGRSPVILLRGSWQSVNIGDIGHTPGFLQMLERLMPEAHVILWSGGIERGAKELLQRNFPKLQIIWPKHGAPLLDDKGRPIMPELDAAWNEADIMIHGSGSGFGARQHLAAFHKATGKPYGVFGTSVDPISGFGEGRDPEGGTLDSIEKRLRKLPRTHLDKETRRIIDNASFMFVRETMSLEYLRLQGVRTPVLEFGPDTQFGMTLRDDARGDAYRAANGLEAGKFICVIPRLRYTPYYEVYNRPANETDRARDVLNARCTEADHAKMRDLITRYVRATGNRVMTCPEMTYQARVAKTEILDKLPDDIRKNVVWRSDYWLPDEAAAIYAKAQAVVSYDCHSPIIALVNNTPTFYVRQPTDTCKGQMYRDIGLDDWFFEIDQTTGAELWARLEAILRAPDKARDYAAAAMRRVQRLQRRMASAAKDALEQ